jgi:hypothetical protein
VTDASSSVRITPEPTIEEAAAIAAAQQAARQAAETQAAVQQTLKQYTDAEGNMQPRKPRNNASVDDAWLKCFAANAIPLHVIEVC